MKQSALVSAIEGDIYDGVASTSQSLLAEEPKRELAT